MQPKYIIQCFKPSNDITLEHVWTGDNYQDFLSALSCLHGRYSVIDINIRNSEGENDD